MVADSIYKICLPVLRDAGLDEEEKTDKLEELLSKETSLSGRSLQDAILGVLWRYRDATTEPPAVSSSPAKHAGVRRGSPAPWQVPRAATPLASPSLGGASPASSHGIFPPPAFPRVKQSTASPFTSPRPSPRLAFTSPIPHSPNLNTYEFSEPSVTLADYGDYGSDAVDWLVNDDGPSRPTSSSATSTLESTLSPAAAPWVQPQQSEMSPYDMLRSILGESKTDEEIETALEANSYDLSATVIALMGAQDIYEEPALQQHAGASVTIGKNLQATQPIPIGPKNGPGKSPVICKYWLATGNCLRSDCRFSHDFGNHLCKYWIMGNCLAGDTCVFSHDPSALMANMNMGGSQASADGGGSSQPTLQVQDFDSSSNLSATAASWSQSGSGSHGTGGRVFGPNPSGNQLTHASASPRPYGSRPGSRPTSRAATPSLPQVDDNEAFPALGAGGVKGSRKHHGKRGGHGHPSHGKENNQDLRLSPSPSPSLLRRGLIKSRPFVTARDQQVVASTITPPEHIPWLETNEGANQSYLKSRQEAFKHGGLRNKFLQSAAQAWNRNDARAAKALSLRGQSENELMRKAHREAARLLYESRVHQPAETSNEATSELYVDLHGLHPEESISYLIRILKEQKASVSDRPEATEDASKSATVRPLYVITGTGHHAKGGKDKVGKAVRGWLGERNFIFREFSVPGDRGNVGGILGVDITTGTITSEDEESAHQQSRQESAGRSADGEGKADEAASQSDPTDGPTLEAEPSEPPVMQMRIPTGPKGLRV